MKLSELKNLVDHLVDYYDEDPDVQLSIGIDLDNKRISTGCFGMGMNEGDDHIEIYPIMGG